MFQNLLIFFLLIVASAEGYLLTMKQVLLSNVEGATSVFANAAPPPKAPVLPQPEAFIKGMKFEGVFTKYVYRLFPGSLSDETKQVLAGYDMTTRSLPGGSVEVILYAKDGGQNQSYVVRAGYSLYFLKILPPEDNSYGYRDSYGIIVSNDGVVQ